MQYWKCNPQGRKIVDNLTGYDGMSVEELCNIASALHSRCEELKSVLKVYEDCLGELEDENKELKAENEQLKKQIGNLEHTKDFCAECCERLEKENEELKSEIRKVQMEYEQLWMHTYK